MYKNNKNGIDFIKYINIIGAICATIVILGMICRSCNNKYNIKTETYKKYMYQNRNK
jgi:hypothetical protein